MSDIQAGAAELLLVAPLPVIPVKFGAALPDAMLAELALLPATQQDAFLKAYQLQSCSLLLAYLSSLIYCHYGLLGRWAMTGMMFASLFVAVALGWAWWLIDLARMPRMVREHNQRVAAKILRQLNVAREPAPLAGA